LLLLLLLLHLFGAAAVAWSPWHQLLTFDDGACSSVRSLASLQHMHTS
jgi:hypothetical protein